MNRIFSMEDFPDLLWQSPVTDMSRSASEWELDKFLEEFPSTSFRDKSYDAVSKSVTPDLVVEIGKAGINTPSFETAELAPPSKDTEKYHAYLRSQLDLACAAAAAANSRDLGIKPEDASSSIAEDQRSINKNRESSVSGKGNGHDIPKEQKEGDGGSPSLPALPSMLRKQEVPVIQATSGSSRDDSDDDELEGDTETNENMDPADEKRARRMQSNRESARRSRRRKQAQLSELEAQVGQLRDERTSLLTRLTDINKKCNEASVDNRILNANIETLRTKVKMAEDQVKRATGLNPLAIARSSMPSMGMQFIAGQADASANVPVPMQPNSNHYFQHSVSSASHLHNLNSSSPHGSLVSHATNLPANNGMSNMGGLPVQQITGGQNMANAPTLQHVQKLTCPTGVSSGPVPICNEGLSQPLPVAKDNKEK